MLVRRHVAATEQLAACVLVEVAKGYRLDERPPARIGAPLRRRFISSGHHDQCLLGEVRQERGANPVVERLDGFDRVEEQDGPFSLPLQGWQHRLLLPEIEGATKGRSEGLGARVYVPHVEIV